MNIDKMVAKAQKKLAAELQQSVEKHLSEITDRSTAYQIAADVRAEQDRKDALERIEALFPTQNEVYPSE